MSRRTRCLSAGLLKAYLRRTLSKAGANRVETHLALCASCRTIVEVADSIVSLGVPADELKRQIADAETFVETLATLPTFHEIIRAMQASEVGVDRFLSGRLLDRSRQEFGREPLRAMVLARAAIWAAERADSADLQFEGWRDCASLAVRLGQYGEAWEAIDRAEALVPRTQERAYSHALLLYAKAYVASQPDVWKLDDALTWTEDASRVFASTDQERLRATVEMRAFIHNMRGEHAAAVGICRTLWAHYRNVGLALQFALYLIDYGEPDTAQELLVWASTQITSNDVVFDARIAGLKGMALAAEEKWEAAERRLAEAVAKFRNVKMDDTAITVELNRIKASVNASPDSLSMHQQAIADVRAVAAESVAIDRRDPTRRRRLTADACQYLRELAEADALTVDALNYVEEYLDAITRGPARPFVRPISPLVN